MWEGNIFDEARARRVQVDGSSERGHKSVPQFVQGDLDPHGSGDALDGLWEAAGAHLFTTLCFSSCATVERIHLTIQQHERSRITQSPQTSLRWPISTTVIKTRSSSKGISQDYVIFKDITIVATSI
jgi:hypothetical protein